MQRDVLARIFEWNNKAKRKPLVLMGQKLQNGGRDALPRVRRTVGTPPAGA